MAGVVLRFFRANVGPVLAALMGALVLVTRRRNEKLKEKVTHLKIKEEANEVRQRPVPADKHDILDRM